MANYTKIQQAMLHNMEWLREPLKKSATVGQLVRSKHRRLVEVPYTASVADTLHVMQTHNILALPVAAPPGHWIGAGGSIILQSDKATGAPLKQYIGIISTLDILIHLSELHSKPPTDPWPHGSPKSDIASKEEEKLLASSVSSIIGHSIEGLSLWSFSPHTSVLEAMEPLSKGIHRALVALESPPMDHGVETDIASPGYGMLTQTDLIRFLHELIAKFHSSSAHTTTGVWDLGSQSVESLRVVQSNIFGVPANMPLVDVLKCMSQGALTAVAILDLRQQLIKPELVPAHHERILATFSASDLRGFSAEAYRRWRGESVLSVVKRAQSIRKFGGMGSSILGSSTTISGSTHYHESWAKTINVTEEEESLDGQVTCWMSSPLEEVMRKALEARVHRIWVVEKGTTDVLLGLVSFSDILGAVRLLCQ